MMREVCDAGGAIFFSTHIPFLTLFEKENYNVLCGGAKWTI